MIFLTRLVSQDIYARDNVTRLLISFPSFIHNSLYNSTLHVHLLTLAIKADLRSIYCILFYARCTCGGCRAELLQNAMQCQCCKEIDACEAALNNELVLREVGESPRCVTLHPGFKQVCLEVWSLRLAGRKYRKIDKKKHEAHDTENRCNTIVILFIKYF